MQIPLTLAIAFSYVTANLAASVPECFASGPACIRPQIAECRDALLKMRHTDPGFITVFGRHLEWKRNTIDVPRVWHSFPKNCVVKLDAIAEEAKDSFRLQHLTAQGEEIISACINQGTRCGGIMNVGPKRVMHLSVGYYSSVTTRLWDGERLGRNISLISRPGVGASNSSLDHVGDVTQS